VVRLDQNPFNLKLLNIQSYRSYCLAKLPKLKFIDYELVTKEELENAIEEFKNEQLAQ